MKVLVTGSSGMVGAHLLPALKEAGHEIAVLAREASSGKKNLQSFRWNTANGEVDAEALENWKPDAVVHLAGKNLAARRWSQPVKEAIRTSRVEATDRLCHSLLNLPHPPRVFISASAVGYYGDRGEDSLDEQSKPGTGFLPELVVAWESAGAQMKVAGSRSVWLRFGMILSSQGGALKKMLTPFKLGLGGPIGSGEQWVSWISLDDVVRIILFCLEGALEGPVNAVAPEPVRNGDFTAALGRALHRPTLLRAPSAGLRLAFGEMADALLLSSQRVVPRKLQEAGYRHSHPELEPCLRELLAARK